MGAINSRQRKLLRKGLGAAFNMDELRILVSDFLNEDLENIALDGAKETRIQNLVEWANRRERIIELLHGARLRRPKNLEILTLAEEFGMSIENRIDGPADIEIPSEYRAAGDWVDEGQFTGQLKKEVIAQEAPGRQLERIVQERGSEVPPAIFAQNLAELENRVCRVVIGNSGGTGFLISSNLVMTNHHVIEKLIRNDVSAGDACCLFDFTEMPDGTKREGTQVDLAEEWHFASSPPSESDNIVGGPDPSADECDYAILRLAEDIGNEPAGPSTTDSRAAIRGWIKIADPPPPAQKGGEVFVLQHPKQKVMRLTFGRVLGFNDAGNRLRHDANTRKGSSGSPCLNADLELIALHHAGDPDFDPEHRPVYNQAVPLRPILKHLEATEGLEQIWKKS